MCKDLMEGVQSEIVGGGGKLLRSGANEQWWNGVYSRPPTFQSTEGRPDQCEQEECSSDVNANPTRSRPDAFGSLESGTEPDPV